MRSAAMSHLWTRKPIAMLEAEAAEPELQALVSHDGVPLKRTLSALNLVALGIGAIIGAWVIGWDLVLEYALGATTVAIGWSGYVVSFLADFGIVVPSALAQSPLIYDATGGGWQTTGAVINIPAMLVIAAISSLLVIGV